MTNAPLTLGTEKALLRQTMRRKRQSLTEQERSALSECAARHFMQSDVWERARSVALYIACRGEADTARLLSAAWECEKIVYLPLCSKTEPGSMRLIRCTGPNQLSPGAFGIPEPNENAIASNHDRGHDRGHDHDTGVPDCIIVPGLAFSPKGVRLGQGGGYYDRLLAQDSFAHTTRVAFAYAFQIIHTLSPEPWDIPVHALCTEEGFIWTAPSPKN